MARESCFCGWVGELEDREPVYAGDGEWGAGLPHVRPPRSSGGLVGGGPLPVRAAGSACASNPLPVVVPCHRVVRSDGTIGQYVGGVEAKRALLTLEGAA
jgi:6-O-methylguanine DNA methyltransferase, DNA binding domain